MKYPLIILAFVAWTLSSGGIEAQNLKQTIRGRVYDAQSLIPLEAATIQLIDSTISMGVLADEVGAFVLDSVPVGRRSLLITYVGYSPRRIANLMVNSGKEVVLDIGLEEAFTQTEEVIVSATRDKRQPNNEMSTVSSRVFSLEETNRYAGSLNDPSRMAANFAGVTTAGDSRNDIVIRGNAPTGLLWRLEGVDIPNPNHFATQGANGGPIGILNNNLLANSDFMTGAFPAEYSNGLSGAFDLKMRNGNNSQRETMFQMGFNGLELMTEGQISKKKGSSYVAGYRYSTLAVFDAIGISFGDLLGVPYFQDFSFKVNLPNNKMGSFSIFGVGGYSNIDILESKLSDQAWKEAPYLAYQDVRQQGGRGVLGASHIIQVNDKSYLKTTLSLSNEQRTLDTDSITPFRTTMPEYEEKISNYRCTLTSSYVYKLSNRHTIKTGFFVDVFDVKLNDRVWIHQSESYLNLREYKGTTELVRLYSQWQYRIRENLTLNTGINGMLLTLNDRVAVEPRAGLRWQAMKKHAFSVAYGMHNQMQPLELYFLENTAGELPNEKLNYTRSQHYVAGYDWTPWANFRFKLEAYYQYIDQVPVEATPSSFSTLNLGANFDRLPDIYGAVNRGKGQNYGLEITVEKFLARNYYFLITTSLYESSYEGSDGKTHYTAFNQNYVVNGLLGAEYWLDSRNKKQFFFDFKLTTAGGIGYTPVDFEKSKEVGQTVRFDNLAFTEQAPAYFRFDVKTGIRFNHKKFSQEFSISIQNITNHNNIQSLEYDLRTAQVIERYQLGFFPVAFYKINF